MNFHRRSPRKIGGNIKPAAFRKEALVLAELSHVGLALEGGANIDLAIEFAEPAHSNACAFR